MADSKFNIQLTATFDEKNLQTSLSAFDRKIFLTVAVKFDKQQIQTALDSAMGTMLTAGKEPKQRKSKSSAAIDEIPIGKVTSTKTYLDSELNAIKQVVSGYDELGNKITETYLLGEKGIRERISSTQENQVLVQQNINTYDRLKERILALGDSGKLSKQDIANLVTELDAIKDNTGVLEQESAFKELERSIKNTSAQYTANEKIVQQNINTYDRLKERIAALGDSGKLSEQDIANLVTELDAIKDNTGVLEQESAFKELERSIKNTSAQYTANEKIVQQNINTYDRLKAKIAELYNGKQISASNFEELNASLEKTNRETDELQKKKGFQQIGLDIKGAQQQGLGFLQSIKNMVPALTKLNLAWMVVKAGMAILKKAVEAVITSVKELDKSFTEIQMVTKQTAQETAELRDQYIDLARSMGATVKEVTDGANDWLRAGMSIEETNEALEASMVLSKVGMVDSAEATKILVSAMRGYGLEANELMSIVDKLSAVDVAASVSTEDLGLAIQKGSASARLAGLSLDEYLGMVAAVAETTQESGDVIGNSFKRIFARAQQVKLGETVDAEGEDISNYFSDVDEAMSTIGINWANETDNLNDLGAGLDTLAEKWGTLETSQKKQIAQAVAGSHQMDRFIVLMDNYDRAVELAGVSTDSAGSAMEKYDVYLQSLEARMNSAKAAWEEVGAAFLDSGLVDVLADLVVEFSDLLALLIEFAVRFLKGFGLMDILNGVITVLNIILDAVNKLLEWFNWGLEKLGSFLDTRGFYQGIREWLKLDISTELEKQAKETKKDEEATKEATKSYDKYTEAVNEAKKAVSGLAKELNTRITAIDKEKERLDEERQIQDKLLSIEKAREELARAKQGRVLGFRIGKGFVEIEDTEAIQEAQENLNSAIRDYDDTILDINLEKVKQMQEILKAPTENLDSWRDYLDSFSTLLGTEFEGIYQQFVEFMTKLENATKDKAREDAKSNYDKVAEIVSGKNLRFGDYSRWGEVFKSEGVLDTWRNLSDWEKLKLKMSSANAPTTEGWADFVKHIEEMSKLSGADKASAYLDMLGNEANSKILKQIGVKDAIEKLLFSSTEQKEKDMSAYMAQYDNAKLVQMVGRFLGIGTTEEVVKGLRHAIKEYEANYGKIKSANELNAAVERYGNDIAKKGYKWYTSGQAQRLLDAVHQGYATGTTSASGGLSMVGENGPELRVLNRGDGIIPSSITKNLWEMGKNPYKFTDKSGGNNITFTGNLSFPNVTNERDAQAFIDKVMQISVPRMK